MVTGNTLFRVILAIAATITWYSPQCTNGDPFTASWWHGVHCEEAPAKVNYHYLGVATASRDIPFCTKIRFTVIGLPKWAREDYGYLIGRSVVATVVDRLGKEDGQVDFDLWPAAFKVLAGNMDIGVLYVRAEILQEVPDGLTKYKGGKAHVRRY